MTIWLNILKRKLKDYKVLFMMSLFPIMLTVLFVNMFTAVDKVGEKVHLLVALPKQEGVLSEAVGGFLNEIANANSLDLNLVSKEQADFVLEVDKGSKEITICTQGGEMTEESILSNLLDEFATGYAMAQVLGNGTPTKMPIPYEVIQGKVENDMEMPLVITMLIFGIMLGGSFGIGQVFYMKQAAGIRTFTAPLSKRVLFLMEYTTSAAIVFVMGMISMGAYQIIFKIDFLQVFIECAGLLMIASLLTTLLGMTIGLYVSTQDMGENILSAIITFSAMLSGKLMPMFDLGGITVLSPIKPLADGLESLIKTGQLSNGLILIGYLMGVFLLLGGLVAIKLKKGGEAR